MGKITVAQERLANPSKLEQLPIEFYHMGKIYCLSLERAKKMVDDMAWAISQVESARDG